MFFGLNLTANNRNKSLSNPEKVDYASPNTLFALKNSLPQNFRYNEGTLNQQKLVIEYKYQLKEVYYLGADYHKSFSHCTMLDEQGRIIKQGKIKNCAKDVKIIRRIE